MPETRPRIWRARIWSKTGPFEGVGFVFKAPVGFASLIAVDLVDLEELGKISRFQLSPVPVAVMRSWTKADREALQRFEPAFDAVAQQLDIDRSL